MALKKRFWDARILSRASVALLVLILTGCAGEPSIFSNASDNARQISDLIIKIFIIAAVVFVVVEFLLIFAALRYSRKKAGQASQTEGNTRLEIGWTMIPAVVLLIVFVVSLSTLTGIAYQPGAVTNDPPVNVKVIGHQWWWEFDYPDQKILTAGELHVPVNTVINLDIESADVIHSFWVPQLGGKTDAIPGHVNKTWFRATQPGLYTGQCSEFCGIEHGLMRFVVVVDSQADYDAWVKQQTTLPAAPTGAAAEGEALFMKGACVACHTVDGTSAQGKVGPNLTHVKSRTIIAGGALDNATGNMWKWLQDPPAVKPGTIMPNLHLSMQDITLISAYLDTLR
jgi:cytochrome c oxidase subunit II